MINLEIKIKEEHTAQEIIATKVILPIKIPYTKRNKDYSIALTDIKLSFAKDYLAFWLGKFDAGYNVTVQVRYNNQKIFDGYLIGWYYDRKAQADVLTFNSSLHKLKGIEVSTNLVTIGGLGSTNKELYTDGNGFTYIQILYLMRWLFYQAGLSLDVSLVDTQLFKAYDGVWYNQNVYYDQLKVDKGMIMCINQSVSAHRLDIINDSSDNDFASNKIDAFEFIGFICSLFGWSIAINPSTGNYTIYPYQQPASRNYTVNSNTVYEYSADDYKSEINSNSGYSAVHTLGSDENTGAIVPSQERLAYTTQGTIKTPRDVVTIVVGEGKERFQLKNHFMIIMQAGYSDPPSHNLANTVNPAHLVLHMSRHKQLPHKVEKLKIPVDFSKPCVLENTFVFNRNELYCEIEQENLYVPN